MGKLSSIQILVLGFLLVITVGSILLCLPFATKVGETTPVVDAVLTATSATCVTGLVSFDTFTHWTTFGQVVILALIQIGGLGFMSIATLLSLAFRRKISLKERGIIQESLNMPEIAGVVRLVRHVLIGTLIFELGGAILFSFRFCAEYGIGRGIYFSIFHSISSFCNAGFDLFGCNAPYSSLTSYNGDIFINVLTMALIIIGGIGFYVWEDLYQNGFHFRRYRMHTKLVLATTAILIIVPAILFFFLERNGAYADFSTPQSMVSSLFQSVTLRTAGFNTVDSGTLSNTSILLGCILMLIGGSPGSTAGGIKTTSFAVLVLGVVSMFKRNSSVIAFKRRLEHGTLTKVCSILILYLSASLFAIGAICAIEGTSLSSTMYDVFSAIGTVGVNINEIGLLHNASKLILTFLMFFGRLGGLTIMLSFTRTAKAPPVKYPIGKISVG